MAKEELKQKCICFLPLGDENVASSRLRCFKIGEALSKRGFTTWTYPGNRSSDFLFIQKRTDDNAFDAARACKRAGGFVVFDTDDFPSCPEFRKRAGELISLADAVTTATPEQQELARGIFSLPTDKKVFCLPNPADYELLEPSLKLHHSSYPLKVVWFGNVENFPVHRVGAITSLPELEFHAITNASDALRQQFPQCVFHAWSYCGFSAAISSFDICVLSHEGSEISNAKSSNKMATAILHGVPVVASCTPDYERLARAAGVAQWLYDDLQGMLRCVEMLREPQTRNAYLRTAQQTVWKECDVDQVVSRFLAILGSLDR